MLVHVYDNSHSQTYRNWIEFEDCELSGLCQAVETILLKIYMWFRNFNKILNEVINVFVRPQDVVQITLLYKHIKIHVEFVDNKPYLLFVPMISYWIWFCVFQILVHLCKHTSPAEELARKDDLSLLFSAITSWCPPHNAIWRKCAAEILMTLSRHGLTPTVVRYIHGKV